MVTLLQNVQKMHGMNNLKFDRSVVFENHLHRKSPILNRPVLHGNWNALSLARKALKEKFPVLTVALITVLQNRQVFLPDPIRVAAQGMASSWKTKTPWRSNPGLLWRMAWSSVSSVQWRLAVRVSPGSRKSTWAHIYGLPSLMALRWASVAVGDDLCFRVMDAFLVSVDARLRHVSLSSDTTHCRNCCVWWVWNVSCVRVTSVRGVLW